MDSNPELFPENVINETRESLAILFPTENQSGAYLKKYNPEILKGSDYPFGIPQRNWNDISVWRARMGEIYSIYLMPTTTLWGKIHDQRNRAEWMKFWVIGVLLVVMTFVFGCIASATAIATAVYTRQLLMLTLDAASSAASSASLCSAASASIASASSSAARTAAQRFATRF